MITRDTSVIKLSLGESNFGAPPAVRDAVCEQHDGRTLPYTVATGLPELRQATADLYRERHDLDIGPKRICMIAGSSAVLLSAAALTVDPGDDMIVADSFYLCNHELVRSFEGRVIDVLTSAATRFYLTTDPYSQYWANKTKVVMIASSSNPTGTTIDFNVLDEVRKLAASRDARHIVGETYPDLTDRGPDGTEVKSVPACGPNAIVCNGFPKFFGMTGWRLGWAVPPDEPTVLEAVGDPATNYHLCVRMPVQYAASTCFMPESLTECEAYRQELPARRRIVIDGLKRIGLPVEVEPNGAFCAYFDISHAGLDVWTLRERALDEIHAALASGHDSGVVMADTHVHLSYVASREALAEGLERLGTFAESLWAARQPV